MAAIILCIWIQDADRLVEGLRSPDIDKRERAAEELRALGSGAIPALERARRSEDPEVRARASATLRALGAPSVLVEDLRDDDVPGNARAARIRLIRGYGPAARAALLEAVRGDDDQQAIQSAFVLSVMGDGRAALAAEPAIVGRIAAAFFRRECAGFAWVAGHALLRLAQFQSEAERRDSFARALRGVRPAGMDDDFRSLWHLSRELRLPFPRPVFDHYLRNLADNNVCADAFYCRLYVRQAGAAAIPSLRDLLCAPDAQARRFAAEELLEMGVEDLPPRTVAELLQQGDAYRSRVVALGMKAAPYLDVALSSRDRVFAARSARALAEIDARRFAARIVPAACGHLGTDGFRGNGVEAAEALVLAGDPALPALRPRLGSEDEQEAVLAALVLARLCGLGDVDEALLRKICRFAAREEVDEVAATERLFRERPDLWERAEPRIARMGAAGREQAERLLKRLTSER